MDTLQTLTHGALGTAAVQSVAQIDPSNMGDALKIVIQLIIGIATLWSMFKKKAK